MKTRLRPYALAVFVILPVPVFCTTVVVIGTQNGLVISSDSKTGVEKNGVLVRTFDNHRKIAILNDQFLIAGVGTVDITSGPNHFNFLPWAAILQTRIAKKTVEQVADMVKDETASMFLQVDVDSMVKNGTLKKPSAGANCQMFAQFIIAGLQTGTWHIYKVQYDIDWREKHLLSPSKEELEREWNPLSPERPLFLTFGVVEAIQDNSHESYAYKRIKELCPKAVADFESGTYHLPLQETIALSRALVQVEEDTNPTLVGGDIKSAEILPTGVALEIPDPSDSKK